MRLKTLLAFALLTLTGCWEPDPDPTTRLSDPCGGLGLTLPPGCG